MATLIDVIEQVRSRVAPSISDNSLQEFDYVVEQAIPNALREVITKVVVQKDASIRNLVEKSVNVALTAGVGNLSDITSSAEPIIPQFPFIRVTHSSLIQPLQPLPSEFRLSIEPTNADFGFYTVSGGKVRTKDTNGSTTALTGNLSITGCYIPTLANLPAQLLPSLIEEVIKALSGITFENETVSLLENYPARVSETQQ